MKKILFMALLFIVAALIVAAPLFAADKYTDNENGTITDNETGLVWTKCALETLDTNPAADASADCDAAAQGAWVSALHACENLEFAGRTDWRLPNINELRSLVDYGKFVPAIDEEYFPGVKYDVYDDAYWSSTSVEVCIDMAYKVHFEVGKSSATGKSSNHFVRCVAGP